MQHTSLREYVETPQQLYDLLTRLQRIATAGIAWRTLGCLACLVVALVAPGAIGKVALCLSVLAGLAWIWAVADYTCRDWAMHMLTLHDLVRPPDVLAQTLVDYMLAEQASAGDPETEGAHDGQ